MPFSMQSEFDSDEFDREGNRFHYEEDSDSDRLVIDEYSEYTISADKKLLPKREKIEEINNTWKVMTTTVWY